MLASAAVEYSVGPHRGATYDAIQSNDMADDELHLFLPIFAHLSAYLCTFCAYLITVGTTRVPTQSRMTSLLRSRSHSKSHS